MTEKIPYIKTTIAPWFTIQNAAKAVRFYKEAFNATETYRLETPDGGLVVKLVIDAAEFWIGGDNSETEDTSVSPPVTNNIRMILTVANPDALFAKALQAGATEIFPIGEDHGWRLGRLVDPFNIHWEIGHQLS